MLEEKFRVSLKPVGVAILQAEKQLKRIKQKVGKEHQRKLTLHIKALNRALGNAKALCKKFTISGDEPSFARPKSRILA